MRQIEYFTIGGKSPAKDWLMSQDKKLMTIIQGFILRVVSGGSKKNVRSLGGGLFEIKIDRGPGYRVYFGEEGNVLILILVCGTKGTQKRDIITAKKYWRLRNEKA